MEAEPETLRLEQLPTGIRGLDRLLDGGLVHGGVYLVLGQPGTGKTTFGNHLAFNTVASGRNVLYVTVMSEAHDRMLAHLTGFEFLDVEKIGKQIKYMSVYDELLENGLDGVQAALRREVRENGYSLIIIDGASILDLSAVSVLEYYRFIADLSVQMSALGCTIVFLAVSSSSLDSLSIAPYVDGILHLEDNSAGLQDIRYIHMVKVRGVNHIRGRHRFTISDRGIEVYPRLESVIETLPSDFGSGEERVPLGVAELDEMLIDGVLPRSMTLISGPSGIGKTTMGLHFVVAGSQRGERSLMATFHESPQALTLLAEGVGQQVEPLRERGLLRIFTTTDPELPVDDWAWRLLEQVEQYKPTRVFIDGISDVVRLRLEPSRITSFFKALTSNLASRGVTAAFSAEAPELVGSSIQVPPTYLATMSDNVVLMQYVQVVSRMHRIVSVLKIRGTGHEHTAREFVISNAGIKVNADESSAEQILAASASYAGAFNPPVRQYLSGDHEVED